MKDHEIAKIVIRLTRLMKDTPDQQKRAVLCSELVPMLKQLQPSPPKDESVCQEAHRIQGGDRQQAYGHPRDNFSDIARLWEAYLYITHKIEKQLTPEDVASMMILMKISRNGHKPKRDNWVDIAGYAQCGAKIQDL